MSADTSGRVENGSGRTGRTALNLGRLYLVLGLVFGIPTGYFAIDEVEALKAILALPGQTAAIVAGVKLGVPVAIFGGLMIWLIRKSHYWFREYLRRRDLIEFDKEFTPLDGSNEQVSLRVALARWLMRRLDPEMPPMRNRYQGRSSGGLENGANGFGFQGSGYNGNGVHGTNGDKPDVDIEKERPRKAAERNQQTEE